MPALLLYPAPALIEPKSCMAGILKVSERKGVSGGAGAKLEKVLIQWRLY